jgi:hypothetical protein
VVMAWAFALGTIYDWLRNRFANQA